MTVRAERKAQAAQPREKKRLDVLLVERGLFPSREKAAASVMAGVVHVNGMRELKAGVRCGNDAEIEVTEVALKYVSRGGLKLEKALDVWNIDLTDKVAADIGASTGGFTDLMLQSGAAKVYAIDVGYGQLDWKLRNDPRVVNIERTNIRYLDRALIAEPPDFISIDVSFISLRLVLPVAVDILARGGRIVALIKPQFEAERGQVGKKGIVRDAAVRTETVEKVKGYAAANGLAAVDVIESPITGAKGNVEFLGYFIREAE
ncbi:MAG: TlyA family RNA methyltransferase [Clostridiales Family XIII bacterium]|jgi:23S rRNA (cytidine1920-2'-O)/16S rRNA (cytidine1409-2'-O)-methyltransferase|nr:TlyA family RNA methyltransferase [Clostridiales Family XIII bacterium]